MCMTPVWRWVDAAFCAPLHHGERTSLACELRYVARQMSGVFLRLPYRQRCGQLPYSQSRSKVCRLSNGASLLSGGGQVLKVTQVTIYVLPRFLRNSGLTLTLQITDYQ